MPQMSPMNWLNLLSFFYITFMVFNTMNYFIFLYSPKPLKKSILKKNNWKW